MRGEHKIGDKDDVADEESLEGITSEDATRESSPDEEGYSAPSQTEETEEQAEERKARSRRKKRAARWGNAKTTGFHNQFTHFPKDANCPVCNETMVQKAGCATNLPVEADTLPQAKEFADRLSTKKTRVDQ